MFTPRSPRARRDAGERTRPIVELDREPDRHMAPPALAAMVPRATGPRRPARSTLPAMPAPLGKTPTKKMPDIQVFGRDDSAATRAALRFFRERRVVVHYVDLRKRAHRPGRAPALHPAPRRRGAARPDVARRIATSASPTSASTRRASSPGCSRTRACSGCRSPVTERGDRGSGRGDLGRLAQACGRALTRRPADDHAGDRPGRPRSTAQIGVAVHEAGAAEEPQALADPDRPDDDEDRPR